MQAYYITPSYRKKAAFIPKYHKRAKFRLSFVFFIKYACTETERWVKHEKINIKGVSVQTWARTAVLLLALISQLCVILGKRSEAIDVDQWQEYATYILTVIGSVWSWWKNNSFTGNAQKADKMLRGDENDGN